MPLYLLKTATTTHNKYFTWHHQESYASNLNYLLTKIEVFMGKSQTSALPLKLLTSLSLGQYGNAEVLDALFQTRVRGFHRVSKREKHLKPRGRSRVDYRS